MTNYNRWYYGSKIQRKVIARNNFTYGLLVDLLLCNICKRTSVLDIGCGVGTVDFFIAPKVKSVLGIDVSQTSIETARKSCSVLGLTKKLKFEVINFPGEKPKGNYDLIICSEVLEHLPNDKLAIKTIRKLLTKNGLVILSVPLKTAPLYRLGLLNKFDKRVGHLRRYSVEGLLRLLEKSKLKVFKEIKTEGILRNFLYTQKFGGFLVRFANRFIFFSITLTKIDSLLGKFFGYSNEYVIARK